MSVKMCISKSAFSRLVIIQARGGKSYDINAGRDLLRTLIAVSDRHCSFVSYRPAREATF
jgi:hypothetical protein